MQKQNPVIWFEIYVQDMDRARKFYESVLEIKLEKMKGPESPLLYGFPSQMEESGCSGALVKMEGVPPSEGLGTIVYFSSPDCAIVEKRIPKFGGKIERPKMSIGEYGFITLGVDTEGNLFGVHSLK